MNLKQGKPLNLDQLGAQLREVDTEMMEVAKRRLEIVAKIADFKMDNGQPFIRPDVETGRLGWAEDWARTHGMNPEFARQLLYVQIGEACRLQLHLAEKRMGRDKS